MALEWDIFSLELSITFSILIISLIFAFTFKIPILTCKFPFLSGNVCTYPFSFKLRTLTSSPNIKGSFNILDSISFLIILEWLILSIFFNISSEIFFNLADCSFDLALFIWLIVSLQNFSVSYIEFSIYSSNFFIFFSFCLLNFSSFSSYSSLIFLLKFNNSLCSIISSSYSLRLLSTLLTNLSKDNSLLDINFLALTIKLSLSPNFLEISNAFDFPEMPMINL